MKDIYWQSLSRFESYDFVERWYKKAHQRKPSAAKVSQINACFIQGREYFFNAGASAMSVKPLLLYYGALSLSRGVILANNPNKKEESLKKSHGLEPIDWQGTLRGGIKDVLELQIRSTDGTFSELVEVCYNLKTMHKFQGPTDRIGSDGHNLGEIRFDTNKSLLTLDDLISRLLQTGGMYEELTGRPRKMFAGCRIVSHPPGTHFAFPLVGIPSELKKLNDGKNVIIGSSNQVAPGLMQSDDAGDALIFVHQDHAAYELAKKLFPVSHYGSGEFMSVILDFPNGDKMTEFFKLYLVSYCLGMLCRYFPSVWMALLRNEKGDFAQPLLVRAVEAIESNFPEQVLHQLTGYPKKLTQQSRRTA